MLTWALLWLLCLVGTCRMGCGVLVCVSSPPLVFSFSLGTSATMVLTPPMSISYKTNHLHLENEVNTVGMDLH